MKIYKIIIVNILCTFFFIKSFASDAQQVFTDANQAFQKGDFSLATQKYEDILRGDIGSKELYFNLGNSYFRLNQTGKSILNYERALRFSPSDGDIQSNLLVAQTRISENIEPISQVFFVRWWQILRGQMSADLWSSLGLIFLWVGISGLAFWFLDKERTRKKQGFLTAAILIPLSILLFLLAKSANSEATTDRFAVVIIPETPFRPAPDASVLPTAIIHEGVKVEILDNIQDLVKVRLPNGEEGWLLMSGLEKI